MTKRKPPKRKPPKDIGGDKTPIGSIASKSKPKSQPKRWREFHKVHPACELIPPQSQEDLLALGEDIKRNGLREPINVWTPGGLGDKDLDWFLLTGRSRLDAMELVGMSVFHPDGTWAIPPGLVRARYGTLISDEPKGKKTRSPGVDPFDFIISSDIRRRHLTAEERIELAEKLRKAQPDVSARRIAAQAGISPTTQTAIDKRLEVAGDVSTVDTSTDTKGRQQPKRKTRKAAKPAAQPQPEPESEPKIEPTPDHQDSVVVVGNRPVLLPDLPDFLDRREHDDAARIGAAIRRLAKDLGEVESASVVAVLSERDRDQIVNNLMAIADWGCVFNAAWAEKQAVS